MSYSVIFVDWASLLHKLIVLFSLSSFLGAINEYVMNEPKALSLFNKIIDSEYFQIGVYISISLIILFVFMFTGNLHMIVTSIFFLCAGFVFSNFFNKIQVEEESEQIPAIPTFPAYDFFDDEEDEENDCECKNCDKSESKPKED